MVPFEPTTQILSCSESRVSQSALGSLILDFVKSLNAPPHLRSILGVLPTEPCGQQWHHPHTHRPTLFEVYGSIALGVSESAPLVGVDSGLHLPSVLASERRNGRAGLPGCERPLGASTPERGGGANAAAYRLDQPSVGLAPTQRKSPRTPRPKGGGTRGAVRGGCCE